MRAGIRLLTLIASALALLATVTGIASGSDRSASAKADAAAAAAQANPCAAAARDGDKDKDRDDRSDKDKDRDDRDEDEEDDSDVRTDDPEAAPEGSDDGSEAPEGSDDGASDAPSADGGSGIRDDCGDAGLSAPAKPRFGKRLNVSVEAGAVRVKIAGGDGFVGLEDAASVPVGSTIDVRRGHVRLTTVPLPSGRRQSAVFSDGVFRVVQRNTPRRLTELRLVGPAPAPCGTTAGTSRVNRRRGLWGRGKGRFRTRGRHGAATVRGTVWRTVDRCDGTLVTVRRGVVGVRDFARKRTVTVRAGRRYLARARGSR